MNRLIIIGASGHGKVVADIAALSGYNDIIFLDDDENKKWCGTYEVVGCTSLVSELDGDIFVGIGNADIRARFCELHYKRLITLIHPQAVVAKDTEIDLGTVVMAGAIINPGTRIGKGCIINTAASVDHDCFIGDYCHIAVGAHIAGTVTVGEKTWIGAGATVINNISIGKNCVVGAGAGVINNLPDAVKAVGLPAKVL